MEKELKIAELASIWGVSVPTAWNRVKKEGLKTFIKKNENNKEINYVRISDEIISQYVINDNNNLHKDVNNGYYEDMLNNDNVNNVIDAEYSLIKTNPYEKLTETLITVNNDYNNRLSEVYNDYNKRIEDLQTELTDAKSKFLVIEEKERNIKAQEGAYLNEINELKQNNKGLQRLLSIFKYLFITVTIILLMLITVLITVNKFHSNQSEQPLEMVEQVK